MRVLVVTLAASFAVGMSQKQCMSKRRKSELFCAQEYICGSPRLGRVAGNENCPINLVALCHTELQLSVE
jgi:hypothetical protein